MQKLKSTYQNLITYLQSHVFRGDSKLMNLNREILLQFGFVDLVC